MLDILWPAAHSLSQPRPLSILWEPQVCFEHAQSCSVDHVEIILSTRPLTPAFEFVVSFSNASVSRLLLDFHLNPVYL